MLEVLIRGANDLNLLAAEGAPVEMDLDPANLAACMTGHQNSTGRHRHEHEHEHMHALVQLGSTFRLDSTLLTAPVRAGERVRLKH